MAEAQSRYGILEELNQKKIQVKKEIAEIEAETDNNCFTYEKQINRIVDNITEREKTYKRDAEYAMRELKVKKELLEKETARKVKDLAEEISSISKNYEPDFQEWKRRQKEKEKEARENLKRYKEVQERAIADKQKLVEDFEKSINDIKDISKESSKEA